jgi:hypothetical protein
LKTQLSRRIILHCVDNGLKVERTNGRNRAFPPPFLAQAADAGVFVSFASRLQARIAHGFDELVFRIHLIHAFISHASVSVDPLDFILIMHNFAQLAEKGEWPRTATSTVSKQARGR